VTSATWTARELERIGDAEELEMAPLRADGPARRPVPVWVVRVGDELYVRSWRGTAGAWFRAARSSEKAHVSAGGVDADVVLVDAGADVNDAVDAAYRTKYGRYPSYVEPMVSAQARATTLKLVPHDPEERT
jgi:hypothetical protein